MCAEVTVQGLTALTWLLISLDTSFVESSLQSVHLIELYEGFKRSYSSGGYKIDDAASSGKHLRCCAEDHDAESMNLDADGDGALRLFEEVTWAIAGYRCGSFLLAL